MESLEVELREIFVSKGLHQLAENATLIANVVTQTLWLDETIENAVEFAVDMMGDYHE